MDKHGKALPAAAQIEGMTKAEMADANRANLAALVYAHMSMPEFGDIVMHVENLKFGDMPASTFALPDGYAIHDSALHE